MPFYVYIIESLVNKTYYKGFTEDPIIRLSRHNAGESVYTRKKIPWILVYVEECESKTIALKRERSLKKYSHDQILALIQTSKNIVERF